jgi:dipeptidyl aminopeptidase/acylaminoacyl peptidase
MSRFRAGIIRSGFFNWLNRTPHPLLGDPIKNRDTYIDASPVVTAGKIRTPLLIMHGDREGHPVESAIESRALFRAITMQGGVAKYISFPGEGHWYRSTESLSLMIKSMADWCDQHTHDIAM